MKIGKVIRELRKEKGVTLEELSKRSGVAVATLSRIETERMTGTLASHVQIARALGITLPDLYRHIEKEREVTAAELKPSRVRADVFVYDKGSSYEMLTKDVLKKKMMPIVLKVKGKATTHKEENPFGTEKFIYVLDGNMEAHIGESKYELRRGDSLYFDASVPHSFKNLGKTEVRCICIITPPAL